MSEQTTAPPSATEAEYEQAKTELIGQLIRWLQLGDALGKSQAAMSGEFMAAFAQAGAALQEGDAGVA